MRAVGRTEEETMPFTLSKLRFSWIALAAFVGASLVTGSASATCTSMPADGACPPVCCCKGAESARLIRDDDAPAIARQFILSQNGNVCPDIPGCVCCPQAPVAPEPKGQRAEESRPDPGRSSDAARLGFGTVFRPFIGPVPPTISPPQTSPLYLRNSRLLI
jgi:hypothetical protein